MDFRQLRYFVAVAEELSFSQAARRLHVSQPPLSLQIKALEEELGSPLLTRTSRSVELTQAGALFLDQARRALAHLERAGEVVRQSALGETGEIRVAFTASVPMFDAFPRIVHAFRTDFPGVGVDLSHQSTGQQLRALASKDIDVGFLRPSILFVPPPNIATLPLWSDRLMVAMPQSHRLARRSAPLAMTDLADESFILFPRGLGCGLFDHVSVLASRAGFAPQVGQEAREGATIIGLVAAGMGISILPDTYMKTGIPGVIYRELDTPDAQSQVLLAYRSEDGSPLVQRFREAARAAQ